MHRGIEIEYWLQTRNYIYIFITIWQQYKWLEKSLNSALSDTYSRMGFGAGHQKDKCIWNVVDFAIISCGHLVAEWSIPRDVAGGIPTGSRAQRSRERQGEAGRGRARSQRTAWLQCFTPGASMEGRSLLKSPWSRLPSTLQRFSWSTRKTRKALGSTA